MQKLMMCALLGSAVLQAQTIASGPYAWDLGNRSTQIYFTFTGGTISTAVLHFGTTCSYGRTANFVVNTTMMSVPTSDLVSGLMTTGRRHGLAVGESVTLSGYATSTLINGTYVVATVPSDTTFTATGLTQTSTTDATATEVGTGAAWTALVLSGKQLDPGTDYCYKIVANGVDKITNQHFVTLNETTAQAPNAAAPVTWFAERNSEPAGTYNADVTFTTCAEWDVGTPNFQTHVMTLTGANHQRYYFMGEWISPGCGVKQYTAPARAVGHTGWALLYGIDPAKKNLFAPPGTRVGPQYSHMMAKIHNNKVYLESAGSGNYSVTATPCENGNDGGDDGIFELTSAPTGSVPFLQCRIDWPPHAGTINVVAQPCTVDASSNVNFTVDPGHGVTPGMILRMPVNQCSTNGTDTDPTAGTLYQGYLVQSVTATTIQLWNLKRKSGFASITTPFTTTVVSDWRQPQFPEVTTGIGAPTATTCSENGGHNWYLDTSATRLESVWWCVDATGEDVESTIGKYRRLIVHTEGDLTQFGMLQVAVNAKRYKLIGFEVIAPAVPNPAPDGWHFWHGLISRTGANAVMIGVQGGTAEKIIFDRFYVHPEGEGDPPIRLRNAWAFSACSDCGILNSYVNGINCWQGASEPYTQSEGSAWVTHHGGGPSLYRNNFAEGGMTISWYAEQRDDLPMMHDNTLYRNTIKTDFKYMRGHPLNLLLSGGIYENMTNGTRNGPEMKQGKRFSWRGNKMLGWYSTQTKGQVFALQNSRTVLANWTREYITSISNGVVTLASPTPQHAGAGIIIVGTGSPYDGLHLIQSVSGCQISIDWCTTITLAGTHSGAATGGFLRHLFPGDRIDSDVDISWNLITQVPEVLSIIGPNADSSSTSAQTGRMTRVRLSDNLCVDCDSKKYKATDQGNPAEAGLRALVAQYGAEHTLYERNTFYSLGGSLPRLISTEATPANWALRMNDNLYHVGTSTSNNNLIEGDNIAKLAGINLGWTDKPGGWQMDKDVICCITGTITDNQPPGVIWEDSAADLKFQRYSATFSRLRDYRLRFDSPYKGGGSVPSTTRRDVGVNIEQLEAELGDVSNVRLRDVLAASAVLSYKAPDGDACYYQTSIDPTWGIGSNWTSDGGGPRNRNIKVTLDPANPDFVRLACETQQFACPGAGGACALHE